MMIESAYNLLSGERPAPEERAVVPSAHRISQAQATRGEKYRFLTTPEERAALRGLPVGEAVEMMLSEHCYNSHWLIHPTRLGPKDDPMWNWPSRVVDARSQHGLTKQAQDYLGRHF
jgi:hypothetical protein